MARQEESIQDNIAYSDSTDTHAAVVVDTVSTATCAGEVYCGVKIATESLASATIVYDVDWYLLIKSRVVVYTGTIYDYWVVVTNQVACSDIHNISIKENVVSAGSVTGFGSALGDFNKEIAISRARAYSACVDQWWVDIRDEVTIRDAWNSRGLTVAHSSAVASSYTSPMQKSHELLKDIIQISSNVHRVQGVRCESDISFADKCIYGNRAQAVLRDSISIYSGARNASHTNAVLLSRGECASTTRYFNTVLLSSNSTIADTAYHTAWVVLSSGATATTNTASSALLVGVSRGTAVDHCGVSIHLPQLTSSVTVSTSYKCAAFVLYNLADLYVVDDYIDKTSTAGATVESTATWRDASSTRLITNVVGVSSAVADTHIFDSNAAIVSSAMRAYSATTTHALPAPVSVADRATTDDFVVSALSQFVESYASADATADTSFFATLQSNMRAVTSTSGGVTRSCDAVSTATAYSNLAFVSCVQVTSNGTMSSYLRTKVEV